MLGFNGGLLGVRRQSTSGAASGLWMPNEQSVSKRAGLWPAGVTGNYSLYLTVVNASTGGPGTWLTGFPNLDNPKNAFDGNPSTGVACDNGSYMKFEPPASISFNTSLEIGGSGMENLYDSATIYTPTGTETQTASGGKVIFTGPNTFLYFTVQDRPPSYLVAGFNYVKIDGVELVDPT